MVTTNTSALSPIDPASLSHVDEDEKSAPWVVRKLVGSMTGRIVMSSYESLRAAGTSVICLSPWGDSSPLLLPCIRFRDLAVHTVIVATGGMAAVAAPVMGPVSDVFVSSFGDTILVELGLHAGFSLGTSLANDLVFDKPLNKIIPIHSDRLETTAVKEITITLKFKHLVEDAQLGFFRSSIHRDPSLFSSVKDYLSIEKGWFSPYLFASARRPVIPRSMKPDIVFCHRPFLSGDYSIGETLLAESASVITLCNGPLPIEEKSEKGDGETASKLKADLKERLSALSLPMFRSRSRSPSPSPAEPATSTSPLPPPSPPSPLHPPRRMVLVVVGMKPHRSLWTTSRRPGESVIKYLLLNGCVSVVFPVKSGAPLVAWDALTLEKFWEVDLPEADLDTSDNEQKDNIQKSKNGKFEGIVQAMYEYLDLCVDWDRVVLAKDMAEEASPNLGPDIGTLSINNTVPPSSDPVVMQQKREALKDAITLLVASAIRSKDSKAAKKEVEADRAGIAMWRIR